MKTLYLLRHSKSDWDSDFKTDHERGLAPRGIEAAGRVARYMDEYGFHVDCCLSSSAKRCVDTWDLISQSGQFATKFEKTDAIYEAHLEQLLDVTKSTPSNISSLMLIGHNPGLEELAEYLVLGESLDELHNPLFLKFPTSAFLGISLAVDKWSDISPGHGSIILYWIPGRKGR